MFGFLKRRLARWLTPTVEAEYQEMAAMYVRAAAEADAYRSALVRLHGQSVEGLQTLADYVGALMLSQDTEEVTLSCDLLASAYALGTVEMKESEDGSVTLRLPSGAPEEFDHCACGEDGRGD